MDLIEFLNNPNWDKPIFKQLANNDTCAASGHQGGVVIPKDLRPYFPGLSGATDASNPTIDHRITAELFLDGLRVGLADTRYQFQTWGGTRSPESRLTDNLIPLRSNLSGGDFLIIQRNLQEIEYYRLLAFTKNSREHSIIKELAKNKKWGSLYEEAPMTEDDLTTAVMEEKSRELAPFKLFETTPTFVTKTSIRVARSLAFRLTIIKLYHEKCSVCGEVLKTPNGTSELEAAHIAPRSLFGTDDARNGLSLCRRHHWAFDHGLFSVDASRKILVPASVQSITTNKILFQYHGMTISEAAKPELRASNIAFEWHRTNVLLK